MQKWVLCLYVNGTIIRIVLCATEMFHILIYLLRIYVHIFYKRLQNNKRFVIITIGWVYLQNIFIITILVLPCCSGYIRTYVYTYKRENQVAFYAHTRKNHTCWYFITVMAHTVQHKLTVILHYTHLYKGYTLKQIMSEMFRFAQHK